MHRLISRLFIGLLAVGLPVVLMAGTAVAATPQSSATVAHKAVSPDYSYVVASMPLKNLSTGEAEWYYGYVQLWYDTGTGTNWARFVSLMGTGSNWSVSVIREDGAYQYQNSFTESGTPACGTSISGSTVVICSPPIYSPVLKASARADMWFGNTEYAAQTGYY